MSSNLVSTAVPVAESVAPNFPPMTKGLEFEFAIIARININANYNVVIPMNQESEIKDGHVMISYNHIPPARTYFAPGHVREQAAKTARRAVYKLLMENGISVYDPDTPRGEDEYARWTVKREMLHLQQENMWDSSRSFPWLLVECELTTPIFQAELPNIAISKVLNLIKSNLLCLLPHTTGLHVHVGAGLAPIEFEHLRKIAIVLYAIDVWLKGLHPANRQDSLFCPRNRLRSLLAEGTTARQVNTTNLEALPRSNMTLNLAQARRPTEAWIELSKATTSQAVCTLMSTPARGAYNFDYVLGPCKPTIEFRQAAGTMNETWAVHWSNLVVKLVDWARRASDANIEELVFNCMVKESLPETTPPYLLYSVLDIIRTGLQLPEVADYIEHTTPESRSTPRAEGQQRVWRAAMEAECPALGPLMPPRTDWP